MYVIRKSLSRIFLSLPRAAQQIRATRYYPGDHAFVYAANSTRLMRAHIYTWRRQRQGDGGRLAMYWRRSIIINRQLHRRNDDDAAAEDEQ